MLYMARLASNSPVAASMRSESSVFHGSYLMREAITGRPSVTINKPSRGYQEAIKRPSRGHQEAIKKPSRGHQEVIKSPSRGHQTSSEVGSPKDADQHAISTQSTCHHQTISTYRWALRKKRGDELMRGAIISNHMQSARTGGLSERRATRCLPTLP